MATGTGLAPVRGFRNLFATDPFRLLQQRMGRFFEEPFMPWAFQGEEPFALTTWTPSCDIYEANGEIVVKAELPGLKKEDVKVTIENNVLTIRGSANSSRKRQNGKTTIALSGAMANSCASSRSPWASIRKRSMPNSKTGC